MSPELNAYDGLDSSAKLDSFPIFLNLPRELQQMIWRHSLQPRIVSPHLNHHYEGENRSIRGFPIPTLLQVHSASRSYGKTLYKLYPVEHARPESPSPSCFYYFNPDIDILWTNVCNLIWQAKWRWGDDSKLAAGFWTPEQWELRKQKDAGLIPEEPEQPRARRLISMVLDSGVPYPSYFELFRDYPSQMLQLFPDVEELVVILHGNYRLWMEHGCGLFEEIDDPATYCTDLCESNQDAEDWEFQYREAMKEIQGVRKMWPKKLDLLFIRAISETPDSNSSSSDDGSFYKYVWGEGTSDDSSASWVTENG